MGKYIDADRLKAVIERRMTENCELAEKAGGAFGQRAVEDNDILALIDSLQQDETQVDKMLCSQAWWEEQGWIMIPPDATIEGIDSLLNQVRKKLQQEQPEVDLEKEIDSCFFHPFRDFRRDEKCAYVDMGDGKEWVPVKDWKRSKREMDRNQLLRFARHFYLLGISARKEGNK